MNINIYQKYKIKVKKEWTELSEENESKYDNIFEKGNNEVTLIVNGKDLINEISNNLKEDYFSEFIVIGKEYHFEYFNYNNGESEHICYEILENIRDKE